MPLAVGCVTFDVLLILIWLQEHLRTRQKTQLKNSELMLYGAKATTIEAKNRFVLAGKMRHLSRAATTNQH